MVFCTKCGAQYSAGTLFCPGCGAPVVDAPQDIYVAPVPEKKKGHTLLLVLALVLVALACAACAVGYSTLQGANDLEVHYASNVCVRVSKDSVVVPFDEKGEKLSHYRVTLTAIDGGKAGMNATFDIQDENGFSISDVQSGAYQMSITDLDEGGNPYVCPQLEFATDGDVASRVLLTVSANQPDAARASAEAEYGYTYDTADVDFEFADSVAKTKVSQKWSCVQFTNSEDESAFLTLNSAIKQDFDEELQNAKSWKQDGVGMQTLLVRESVVMMNNTSACIRRESYQTDWQGQTDTVVTGCTYNLETGEAVSAASLVGLSDDELNQRMSDALQSYFDAHPDEIDEYGLGSIESSIRLDDSRYYMADEGLVVCVWQSELAEGARGSREIVVYNADDESLVGTDVQASHTEIDWRG